MKIIDPSGEVSNSGAKSSYSRLGLVIEQKLGHITHTQNLARWLSVDSSIQPTWLNVPDHGDDFWQRVPTIALKDSGRAWNLVNTALQEQSFDCLYYHTQATALLSLSIMQRIPTIISLDATPINFSSVAEVYREQPLHTKLFGKLKFEWFRRVFESAAALVTFSDWAKNSLVDDYGIAASQVTVIPPGVDLAYWHPTVKPAAKDGVLRLLFVGGDFVRKGGEVLLKAFQSGLSDRCTLDIVTKDDLREFAGVRIHKGLTPNSPQLRQLYAEADLFVFPTFGDCTPIVVMEAMASGLPVVATDVGALGEQVEHGTNGFLVPPHDSSAIVEVVNTLVDNPQRLVTMGAASRTKAENLFNGEHNYKALIALMKQCVQQSNR
jgi:glycosyltransferase involved in cell wall biosynthesis